MRVRAVLAMVIAIFVQALAVDAEPPGPPGIASPAPIVTPTPVITPTPSADWTVNRTAIGLVIDQLTDKMFGFFRKFTEKSVRLAQTLFMSLASIELGWTSIRWFASSVPLEEYVANSLFKIVQLSLLFTVISNSYSSPFGPGWFMMIVNGIVGMAQDTAGFDVIGLSPTGQFAPTITPGTIMDIGLRLFTLIMTAASGGTNSWNLLAGMTNGATMIYFGQWCFCLLSACGVVFLMAWIAFRWFWTTMHALWQGTMVFLTGFSGSRVTASIGYGPFNAAFNVGVEMAAHVVIIGMFYPIITAYVGSVGFADALQGVPSYIGPVAVAGGTGAAQVMHIGAVLLLDLGIALWAYAIKRAPDMAAGVISGTIRLNEKDALEGVKGESTVLQGAGMAARVGAGGMAGFAGSSGGDQAQPSVQDRLKGAFSGAIRGGLMAGPEGALGGAAMGAATASASSPSGQTEGHVQGGAGGESAPAAPGRAGSFAGGFVDLGRTASSSASGARGTSATTQRAAGEPDRQADAGSESATGTAPAATTGSAGSGGRVTQAGFESAFGDSSPGAQGTDVPGSDGTSARTSSAAKGGRGGGARQTAGASVRGGPARQPDRQPSSGSGAGSARGDAQSGSQEGGPYAADAVIASLTRALQENTEALRGGIAGSGARAVGGASGGDSSGGASGSASGGSASGSGASGSGAGGGLGGPLGGLLGGGAAASPVNMMLYRQLLSVGRRQKPDVHNERPAVSLGVGHIE